MGINEWSACHIDGEVYSDVMLRDDCDGSRCGGWLYKNESPV